MANTLLTPTMITREAQMVLHQKLNLVGNMNRQYDSQFARTGGKIGTSLNLRVPPKYTVRSGATYSAQNVVERQVALPCATQKGIDCTISDVEMAMSLENFRQTILEPAMAQLAAQIEYDALAGVYVKVPNYVGTVSSQIDFKKFQQCGQVLTENLAPVDRNRVMGLNPSSRVEFSDAVKGLFQSSDNIDAQYREGKVGRTGGFDVYENTLIPAHTTGTYGGTPLTNGANQGSTGSGNAYPTSTDLITDGWTVTTTVLKAGDIITIGDVYEVHPETKVSLGRLKRFVVTADTTTDGAGNSTITISPAIIAGGAYQNVTARAGDGKTITVLGTSATAYGQNLAFHRDAFAFVTADLVIPNGVDMAAREVYDGISMRFVRWYDGDTGDFKSRFDILYGYAAVYPELACRLVHQLT